MNMNSKQVKKMICGLTLGCFALTVGAVAMADNTTSAPAKPGCRQEEKMSPEMMQQRLSQQLNVLVSQGTITQNQANKALQFFKDKAEERQAEMDKMKALSPEERHAQMEQKRGQHPDFVNELKVAAGLSSEQAKAVADALRPAHGPKGPHDPEKMMSNQLAKLVTEGTITQAQANDLGAFFKEKATERRAEMDKVKDMSPEERHSYMEAHRKSHEERLAELQQAGHLSDDQAKAVADALRPAHDPKGPHADKPAPDEAPQG